MTPMGRVDEAARLAALRGYGVLDTAPEAAFDRLTALAADLFDAPIALVSLIDADRQWIKSAQGLQATETPREHAFCDHVIRKGPDAVMVVQDATVDRRFADNPYVLGDPDVRFYAGAALTTRDGHNLGALCVIDRTPRPHPDPKTLQRLQTLAGIVVDELELRKAGREMARRQTMLNLAETMAGVCTWRHTPADGRLEWSDEVYRLYGVQKGLYDPNAHDPLAFYDPDSRRRAGRLIREALQGRAGHETALFDVVRADGVRRRVASAVSCEFDEAGAVSALVGVVQDVTEREQALADALRAREIAEEQARRATQAEDVAGLGYWRLETRSGLLHWSAQMYAIYGLPQGEPVGMARLLEMTHPEDRDGWSRRMTALLAGEGITEAEVRIVRADGGVRWLRGRATAERSPDGAILALVGTVMDITQQHVAAAALADSETRYRVVTDAVRDVILQYDLDGTIRYASGAARQLGYHPAALIGLNCADLMHPMDVAAATAQLLALHDRAAAEGPGEPAEYRIRAADGAYVWIEGNPTLLRDARGKAFAYVNTLRDITARKTMEEALRAARAEAEAAAAVKAEFLANMSHELRTPLTSVLGFTRLALEQADLSDATRGYVTRAAGAGSALLTTVNDILDFSKLEAGQVEIRPRPADAADVAQGCLDLFSLAAAEKGLGLRLDVDGALPAALVFDPERVRQLLINLVGNAIKFSDAGDVILSVGWREDRLAMTVADQGPGLATGDQEQLFRRFSQVDGSSTRRHGGSGLGLAICKGLVEAMGGEIGVDSAPGRGARFRISLPAPAAAPAETISGAGIVPGTRVLAVDDHPVNLALVRAILAPFGCQITEADDGEGAVALADETPFDIILMDLRMPGLGGLAAAQAIRRGGGLNAGTPIIALSGDIGDESAAARLAAGFDGELAKPVTPGALALAVARHTSWEICDADDAA